MISKCFLLSLSPITLAKGRPAKAITENIPVTTPAVESVAPRLTANPGTSGIIIPKALKFTTLTTSKNINSLPHPQLCGGFFNGQKYQLH